MIECIKYTPVNKGFFLGSFNIYIEKWGIEIKGCKLFQKGSQRWMNFPDKEFMVNDEKKYMQFIVFKEPKNKNKFQEEVLKAIDKYCAENQSQQSESDGDLPF